MPSINALKVNKLNISDILSERDSYYEMTLNIHKLYLSLKIHILLDLIQLTLMRSSLDKFYGNIFIPLLNKYEWKFKA